MNSSHIFKKVYGNRFSSVAHLACVVMAGTVATSALAEDARRPSLIPAPVDRVFVPLGFDNNDNVEVILHGHFTSNCAKVGPASATVDENTKTISVVAQAWTYSSDRCLTQEMYTPFVQSVPLGVVGKGEYTVRVLDASGVNSQMLQVAEAKQSTPDDYLYAPVEDVQVDTMGAGKLQLTLRGEYPAVPGTCYKIKEVRSQVVPGNTVVVLPIMEKVKNQACQFGLKNRRFSVVHKVDAVPAGETLIHVRALSGQSLNRVTKVD